MKIKSLYLILSFFAAACAACSTGPISIDEELTGVAPVFPDYVDCTIPPNITPMNFALRVPYDRARVTFTAGGNEWSVEARRGQFTIPVSKWREMLEANRGGTISVKIVFMAEGIWKGYPPFALHVAPEPVDPYVAYRLIEPGYDMWMRLGIHQRDLESYRQTPIMENKLTEGSCINCHSFRMQDPDDMLFHMRGANAGTMLVKDGEQIEKLNTKTPETMSAFTYPSWHPSGRFVAFSLNDAKQAFHMNHPNRVEEFDIASDMVVYDVERHEVVTSLRFNGTSTFESFPTFSPDGHTLYFSSAPFVSDLPLKAADIRYNLCAVSFDPDSRTFGSVVDTLYNARTEPQSATFPRVSPDGKYLLYTLSDCGGFGIWHKEADLWLVDLSTGEHKSLGDANTDYEAESYHSWSSNSRWVVFSSRRIDGLYTRAHIAYVDENGSSRKAFVLPQKNVDYYDRLMYSHNVPEFIKGKVKDNRRRISRIAKRAPGIDVRFAGASE